MEEEKGKNGSVLEVLAVSAKLGLTSFGGPVAHLGYFYDEYIRRRKWLDENTYADLVALCQFLPGPASSQVGIAIGMLRAGLWGGLAAWLGFTLPSALALYGFATLMQSLQVTEFGWLKGLKIVAVAVVAQAVWDMGRNLAPDRIRAGMAILAATFALLYPSAWTQILIIAGAGLVGSLFRPRETAKAAHPFIIPIGRTWAIFCLTAFFVLLLALPFLSLVSDSPLLSLFDRFYRAGSLVFGGGHVVLPLLEKEVVASGWVSETAFVAGYGAAQAVPGPLFTFASYLGAVIGGGLGAVIATIAIFLPSFLLVPGTLPFWGELRSRPLFQGAVQGMNAAVVGILLAALYHPLWTGSIQSAQDCALALLAFGMLAFWKLPPWCVVLFGVAAGLFFL